MGVDPGPVLELRGVQLTRRQHHLAQVPAETVAVDIDVREVVIGADLLELLVGPKQRAVVPQADVPDGVRVCLDFGGGGLFLGGHVEDGDAVEVEGLEGGCDVVADVGFFPLELVRLHDVGFHEPGDEAPEDENR